MKKLLIIIFIIIAGCSPGKKVYICGDHVCKNKKEIDEYFAQNISIEVYIIESKRGENKNRDLVQANLSEKKISKNKKKNDLNFIAKRQQKPKKLKLETEVTPEEEKKVVKLNELNNKESIEKSFSYKKTKKMKIVHLCKNLEKCDIDLISKQIIDLGKKKSFPDISFNNE